jgi:hypothetical protein
LSGAARPSGVSRKIFPPSDERFCALLLDPARAFWSARAPATFTADIETSRGTIFEVEPVGCISEWRSTRGRAGLGSTAQRITGAIARSPPLE